MDRSKLLPSGVESPRKPTAVTDGTLLLKLISFLPYVSFSFMLYSAITAILNSREDPANLAFVIGSFTLLGLLYFSMWEFERTRASPSPTKNLILKSLIWSLSVTLTCVFAHRVTTMLDSLPLQIFIWSVAGLTSTSGFYFLFIMEPKGRSRSVEVQGLTPPAILPVPSPDKGGGIPCTL